MDDPQHLDDPYVDRDAWKFIETCRKDELNIIKKAAKVEFTASGTGELVQVNIIASPEVSDTTVAKAELGELINLVSRSIRSEQVSGIPHSTEQHRMNFMQIVEGITDLCAYRTDSSTGTYMVVGTKGAIKNAQKQVQRRFGYVPFTPREELSVGQQAEEVTLSTTEQEGSVPHSGDSDDELQLSKSSASSEAMRANSRPEEKSGGRSVQFSQSEEGALSQVPSPDKAISGKKPQKKQIRDDNDMDELFGDPKCEAPRLPSTPCFARAPPQSSDEPLSAEDEKALLIKELIESGDPDAEEKIDRLLAADERPVRRADERPIRRKDERPIRRKPSPKRVSPRRFPEPVRPLHLPTTCCEEEVDIEDDRLDELLQSDDPAAVQQEIDAILARVSARPKEPRRQQRLQEDRGPLDVLKKGKPIIETLKNDVDELASLFTNTCKDVETRIRGARQRHHSSGTDSESEEEEPEDLDDLDIHDLLNGDRKDGTELLNHDEWLAIVEASHPNHRRRQTQARQDTMSRPTTSDRAPGRMVDVENEKVRAARLKNLQAQQETIQPSTTKSESTKKTLASKEPVASFTDCASTHSKDRSDSVETGTSQKEIPRDVRSDVEDTDIKCPDAEEDTDYKEWLQLLESGIITYQQFETWNKTREWNAASEKSSPSRNPKSKPIETTSESSKRTIATPDEVPETYLGCRPKTTNPSASALEKTTKEDKQERDEDASGEEFVEAFDEPCSQGQLSRNQVEEKLEPRKEAELKKTPKEPAVPSPRDYDSGSPEEPMIAWVESGPQPEGGEFDAKKVKNEPLEGHDEDYHFEVIVTFPETPDEHASARFKCLFPGSDEGFGVASLFNDAYKQRKLFRVKAGRVVWNDFTPKTNKTGPHGFPDPFYLDRAKQELERILDA